MTRDLFNLELGRELREDGKEAASVRNAEWLQEVRDRAVIYAKIRGRVTTDDLHDYCRRSGAGEPSHPNAWGAVFSKEHWECIGWTESERPEAHGRAIRIWKLKEKK